MPRFDLAGNPLPDKPPAEATPRTSPPPRVAAPHADIPTRHDAQGRLLHTAPAPPAQMAAIPPVMGDQSAAPVRYDLAGNPLPAPTYSPGPSLTGPLGSAGAATWPPAPAGLGLPFSQNTSGEQGDVPPEIARLRWNWGAYFFPILWCKKHGMTTFAAILGGSLLVLRWARRLSFFLSPAVYILLVVAYGITYFGISVYFGLTGHRQGWRNRRFDSVQDYLSCQTKWMWWGVGINAFLGIILPILLVMGVIGMATLGAHSSGRYSGSYSGGGYSSPYSGNAPSNGSGDAAPAPPGDPGSAPSSGQ